MNFRAYEEKLLVRTLTIAIVNAAKGGVRYQKLVLDMCKAIDVGRAVQAAMSSIFRVEESVPGFPNAPKLAGQQYLDIGCGSDTNHAGRQRTL